MDDARAKRIQSLLSHPAWPELEEEIELSRNEYLRRLTAAIARGDVFDQRELDYMRGRYDGAKLVLKQPGRSIRQLDMTNKERETVE